MPDELTKLSAIISLRRALFDRTHADVIYLPICAAQHSSCCYLLDGANSESELVPDILQPGKLESFYLSWAIDFTEYQRGSADRYAYCPPLDNSFHEPCSARDD